MHQTINKNRLFLGSCLALITTAMAFAIRAGIMDDLAGSKGFGMTDSQLGWLQFMGNFGFPIATLIGGPLYNTLGPKKLGYIAFFGHLIGITFSILSTSAIPLLLSTLFISFGNGMVEAAFNPLIASLYHDNKTTMLNRFHVWFPGGIVIGALVAYFLTQENAPWQLKIATMYIPTFIYGFLFLGQQFPTQDQNTNYSTTQNFKAILKSPLYWFMLVCMVLTATSELGTQSWVERILGNAGAQPLLVLALVTGIMALGRYFAGPIIHRLSITGVLLTSAIITTLALVMMSNVSGNWVYASAILFAIGVCYFWPNMISFVAVYLPETGALGMSLIGGVGMIGLSIFQPIIGSWLQSAKIEKAQQAGFDISQTSTAETIKASFGSIPVDIMQKIELEAGRSTLDNIAIIPAILIVAFAGLFIYRRLKRL